MLKNPETEIWIEKSNTKSKILVLMAAGIISRILLNLYFHLKYGVKAINHIELWLYTGVAKGTHVVRLEGRWLDPTSWVLWLVEKIFPGDSTIYGVELMCIILSIFSGVLLYLIVREKFGEKTGFYSAILYIFSLETIALNTVSFTHASVQIPFMLGLILTTIWILKSKKYWKKIILIILYVIILFFGFQINKEMIVGLALSGIYFLNEITPKKYLTAYQFLVLAILLFSGFTIIPDVLGALISELPQGQSGSADVMPITIDNLWLRYNLMWILAPISLISVFKRKDILCLAFILIGLLISFMMDRGTRIMTIGMSMLTAHAFTLKSNQKFNFKINNHKISFGLLESSLIMGILFFGSLIKISIDKKYSILFFMFAGLMILKLIYDKKNPMEKSITYFSILFFLITSGIFFKDSSPLYIIISTLLLLEFLKFSFRKNQAIMLILIISTTSFAVNFSHITYLDVKRISYQLEYEVLDYLKDLPDGKILIEWDKGYMAEVISGKKSVTNPGTIDKNIHNILWLFEDQSANYLARSNVKYVLFTSKNLNLVQSPSNNLYYAISGGMLFKPDYMPHVNIAGYTTAYKLRHNLVNQSIFRFLKGGIDEKTGVEVNLYEVILNKNQTNSRSSIKGLFRNTGGNKTANIAVLYQQGEEIDGIYVNETIPEGISQKNYWIKTKYMDKCGIDPRPLEGMWGYIGEAAFRYSGPNGQVKLGVKLVEEKQSTPENIFVEDIFEKTVYANTDTILKLPYNFRLKQPFGSYSLLFMTNPYLTYLESESTSPVYDSVDLLHVSCWPMKNPRPEVQESKTLNIVRDVKKTGYAWIIEIINYIREKVGWL